MAIKLVATIQQWIGVSSDTRPTSAPQGSTFHETDTGRKFIWKGSVWIEDLSESVSTKNFDQKNDEMRRLAELQLISSNPNNSMVPYNDGAHHNFTEVR